MSLEHRAKEGDHSAQAWAASCTRIALLQPVIGGTCDSHARCGPAGVLADVGQRLLHDAVGVASQRGGHVLDAHHVLALLGLRYPQRMLPSLLFEVGWKLTWLGSWRSRCGSTATSAE